MALLSVAGDWAYVPSAWKAIGDEDPAFGIPTTYYAAVQLSGVMTVVDDPAGKAEILRRQLATTEPGSGVVDPAEHARSLPGIRGLRMAISDVTGQVQVRRERRRRAPRRRGRASGRARRTRRRGGPPAAAAPLGRRTVSRDFPPAGSSGSRIAGVSFERLHHVQLAIPPAGENDCRRFWGGIMGLTEVDKPPALAVRGGCWFRGGGLEVHLGVESDFAAARKAHPGILVAGLDALAARFVDAGVEVRWDANFPGYRRFYADDPFGNRLEFLEPEPS